MRQLLIACLSVLVLWGLLGINVEGGPIPGSQKHTLYKQIFISDASFTPGTDSCVTRSSAVATLTCAGGTAFNKTYTPADQSVTFRALRGSVWLPLTAASEECRIVIAYNSDGTDSGTNEATIGSVVTGTDANASFDALGDGEVSTTGMPFTLAANGWWRIDIEDLSASCTALDTPFGCCTDSGDTGDGCVCTGIVAADMWVEYTVP